MPVVQGHFSSHSISLFLLIWGKFGQFPGGAIIQRCYARNKCSIEVIGNIYMVADPEISSDRRLYIKFGDRSEKACELILRKKIIIRMGGPTQCYELDTPVEAAKGLAPLDEVHAWAEK